MLIFPFSMTDTIHTTISSTNIDDDDNINNDLNTTSKINNPHNLCVFVWATTYKKTYTEQLKDIMDVYRDRDDVFFIMDDLKNTYQYKICNLLNRCFFVNYNRKTRYRLSEKTITAFQFLYDNEWYNKCNWIMKIDTDSYVDIDRFNDFLSYNYDSNKKWYFGHVVTCLGGQLNPNNVLMAQGGGYIISQSVLRNYKWNFKQMVETKYMKLEDCMMAFTLYNNLNLRIHPFIIGIFMFRTKENLQNSSMEKEWDVYKKEMIKQKLNGCTFVWHKVDHSFRLKLIAELKTVPFHEQHCQPIATQRGVRWMGPRP